MVTDQVSIGAGEVQKLCFWPDNCEPSGPCVLDRYRGADNNPQMTIILVFYAWLRLGDGWVPLYTQNDWRFAPLECTQGALTTNIEKYNQHHFHLGPRLLCLLRHSKNLPQLRARLPNACSRIRALSVTVLPNLTQKIMRTCCSSEDAIVKKSDVQC